MATAAADFIVIVVIFTSHLLLVRATSFVASRCNKRANNCARELISWCLRVLDVRTMFHVAWQRCSHRPTRRPARYGLAVMCKDWPGDDAGRAAARRGAGQTGARRSE